MRTTKGILTVGLVALLVAGGMAPSRAGVERSRSSDGRGAERRLSVAATLPDPTGGIETRQASPRPPVDRRGCYRKIPRSKKDRPDLRSGHVVHVIYLVAADARDERLDAKGTLACSVRTQEQWFEEASGGWRWRFDTFKTKLKDRRTGKMRMAEVADVSFVRSARPGSELGRAFDVKAELENHGFSDPNKRYLSFVEAPSNACGDAVYPLAVVPQPPPTDVDGKYAQVYLLSDEGCRARDFGAPGAGSFADMIAQQELMHNDGLVSAGAPHGCVFGVPPGMGHVCTGPLALTENDQNLDPERVDVMYPFVSVPLAEKMLDAGNDDYFNHPFPHVLDLRNSPYVENP